MVSSGGRGTHAALHDTAEVRARGGRECALPSSPPFLSFPTHFCFLSVRATRRAALLQTHRLPWAWEDRDRVGLPFD